MGFEILSQPIEEPEKPLKSIKSENISENSSEQGPFKGLKRMSEKAPHYEVEGASNLVVRKEKLRFEALHGNPEEDLVSKTTIRNLVKGKNVFSELRDKYGVAIPKFQFVIGEDSDKEKTPRLYTITEKIDGKNLMDVEQFESDDMVKIDRLFEGIAKQILDAYENGGSFWIDGDQSQVILGTRQGETEKQPYVVDVEPRITSFDGLLKPGHLLLDRAFILLNNMESIESRAQGIKLTRFRGVMKDIFNKIPVPAPDDEYFKVKVLPAYNNFAEKLTALEII